MKQKIKWAYKVLRAKAYVIATDTEAVAYVSYLDPYAFDSMLMIHSQKSAIKQIIDNLKHVMKEYDDRLEELNNSSKGDE